MVLRISLALLLVVWILLILPLTSVISMGSSLLASVMILPFVMAFMALFALKEMVKEILN